MKLKNIVWSLAGGMACVLWSSLAWGQTSATEVGVGRGFASAVGSADGAWKLVDTNSHVGRVGSLGRALAVGVGPAGVSLSHSIGIHGGPAAAGHNFNLSVGRGGSHVSHGAVLADGGPASVIAGGRTQISQPHAGFPSASRFGVPQGGSTVAGYGQHVRAYSKSHSQPAIQRGGVAHRLYGPFRRFPH